MNITKRGILPGKRKWKGACHTCNSEAEAEEAELVGIQQDQRDGVSFCWMKCPVCGEGPFGGMIFYPVKP